MNNKAFKLLTENNSNVIEKAESYIKTARETFIKNKITPAKEAIATKKTEIEDYKFNFSLVADNNANKKGMSRADVATAFITIANLQGEINNLEKQLYEFERVYKDLFEDIIED